MSYATGGIIKAPSVYRGVNHYKNPVTLEDHYEYTSRTYDKASFAKGMATRMRDNHKRRAYGMRGQAVTSSTYWYRSEVTGKTEDVDLIDSWVEEAPTVWRRI